MAKDKDKLTRGQGTGAINFGSEAEERQSAATAREIERDTRKALVTPQERFDRIERALYAVADAPSTPPETADRIRKELDG